MTPMEAGINTGAQNTRNNAADHSFRQKLVCRTAVVAGLTHTSVVVCCQLKPRTALAVKGTWCVHASLVAIWRHGAFIYI